MNKVLLAVVFLFYSGIITANNELQSNVKRFIDAYISGDIEKASAELFCPQSFSKNKLIKKRKNLVGELQILIKNFGKIVSISPIKNKNYTTLMLACSAKSDYQSFKLIGADTFLVSHKNGIKSILKLYYIPSHNHPVLGVVGIGEAGFGYSALKRQYEKHNQLSK